MTIEIHKAELEQRLRAQIQSGQFHDVDELLEKALDALQEKESERNSSGVTGAAILAVLQASPYREIDLTANPERLPVRDVVI